MNDKLQYLVAQLKDPATWRGFFMLLTAFGIALKPDQMAAITTLGMAIVGAIGVFAPPSKQLTPDAAKIINQAVADAKTGNTASNSGG